MHFRFCVCHVSLPSLTVLVPLNLCRLHPEELGGPPLKKLKQEVGFPGQISGVRAAVPSPLPSQSSLPYLGHPQVGEQSHSEIQQPPPGPESYAPPFRPSLEEDSASLSGESLDGHLQGEYASQPFLLWG